MWWPTIWCFWKKKSSGPFGTSGTHQCPPQKPNHCKHTLSLHHHSHIVRCERLRLGRDEFRSRILAAVATGGGSCGTTSMLQRMVKWECAVCKALPFLFVYSWMCAKCLLLWGCWIAWLDVPVIRCKPISERWVSYIHMQNGFHL